MKGLELSRRFWEAHASALFSGLPEEVRACTAVGLVGSGSECFGFDDAISVDHDFGPGFCLWLPSDAYARWSAELTRRYDALPASFLGFKRPEPNPLDQRVGVFEIGSFYRRFTGLVAVPTNTREWLAIPEQLLACATNGEVFCDPRGDFSALRSAYLGFYPEEVVKQKIAANCARMAQAGQYNLRRCLKRSDVVAASTARTEFVMSLLAVLHLFNRTYMPFYKWSFRSLCDRCSVRALAPLAELIKHIAAVPVQEVSPHDVETACVVVRRVLASLGWATEASDFLLDVAQELRRGLKDSYLRSCPLGASVFG